MKKVVEIIKGLSPDALVALLLSVWFAINLLQGALSGLNNDEAYYHLYAQNLAWGYFDHPPMIALLVWLSEWVCGVSELGVRLFVIVLQPLYLYLFWRTIRPADASRQDAMLYILINASIILLQAYGFIAVPDAPLMFCVALFLWSYRLFLQEKCWGWLWLGVAMAAMAYSKYQGALVVIFAVAFNPRLLLNPRFYLSGGVALALFAPHMWWQFSNDFPSFGYHLSERNRLFEWSSVSEFFVNLLLVFNPFFVTICVQAYRKVRCRDPFEIYLKWMPLATFLFFLLSSVRGRTQPQWMIASTFGLVWLLFSYARGHRRTRQYIVRLACVTLALVAILRVEIVVNLLGLSQRQGFYGNEEQYGAIAKVADGRPVIFSGSYAIASKYIFYTDGEGYCTPSLGYRTHQWQYVDDTPFAGREVLVEYYPSAEQIRREPKRFRSIDLPNGAQFQYYTLKSYTPLKRVRVESVEPLPATIVAGEPLELVLSVENPYPEDLISDSEVVRMLIIFRDGEHHSWLYNLGSGVEMKSGETSEHRLRFTPPTGLPKGEYQVGFSVISKEMDGWFSSPPQKIEVL